MSSHPSELRYTSTHEWVRDEGGNIYSIGITEHAQSMLGDIVFVEIPELDIEVGANEEVAVIESVKTAADVYSPLTGHIIAVNEQLTVTPEVINRDPYGDGWLFRIKIDDADQLEALLDANAYEHSISE